MAQTQSKIAHYTSQLVELEARPYDAQPYSLKLYTTLGGNYNPRQKIAVERKLWNINKSDEEWELIVNSMIAEIPTVRRTVSKRISEAHFRSAKGEI